MRCRTRLMRLNGWETIRLISSDGVLKIHTHGGYATSQTGPNIFVRQLLGEYA